MITMISEKSEKRFIVGRLQTKNLEPYPSLGFSKRKLEGDRPLGNSIGALLGGLFNNKYVERIGEKPQFVTKSF